MDRLRQGVQLEREGEFGLARLELEAAIAAPSAADALGERGLAEARALLVAVTDRLARARLDEARSHAEAEDAAAARAVLETVRSLRPNDVIVGECAALEASLRDVEDAPTRGSGSSAQSPGLGAALGDVPLAFVSVDDDDAALPAEPAGDDHLDPLEQVLLTFPDAEAERLAALAEVDAELALALSQRGSTEAAAMAAWERVSAASAAEPLVRREHARALLVAQREKQARPLLEAVLRDLPEDLDTIELTLEARLVEGDSEGAADLARGLLSDGRARDLGMIASALARSGHAAEALTAVDRALDAAAKSTELWELRGSLCQALGSDEGVREADDQALDLYRQQCSSCGPVPPSFPLASGRRKATRGLAAAASLAGKKRQELADLVRTLASIDREREAEWHQALTAL